ncbi:UNVERIFIED_CONTAM: glutamate dehydrogenase, partial [Prevotella sp. 15_C9]
TKLQYNAKFTDFKKECRIPFDFALPCALLNELSEDDAKDLKANGSWSCCEVTNIGSQPGPIHFYQNNGILFAQGKTVNAVV